MGKHLARVAHVTNGIHALHVGFTTVVDLDETSFIERHTSWCKGCGVWFSSDGYKHLVNNDMLHFFLVFFVLIDEVELNTPIFCCFSAFCKDAEMGLDLLLLDGDFEWSTKFLIEDWQYTVHCLDHGHF